MLLRSTYLREFSLGVISGGYPQGGVLLKPLLLLYSGVASYIRAAGAHGPRLSSYNCARKTPHNNCQTHTKTNISCTYLNPLVRTLKPQSNDPLYSNALTMGCNINFGTARRGMPKGRRNDLTLDFGRIR